MYHTPDFAKPCMVSLAVLIFGLAMAGPALGTSYHALTIDGTNDFANDEDFTSSSAGYAAYFTWSASDLYLGYTGNDINSGQSSTKWIVWFFDTDPQVTPTSGMGTTIAPTFNTQNWALPFSANYMLQIRTDGGYVALRQWNGSSWVNATFNGAFNDSNAVDFIEVRLPRSDLGNPNYIYTLGYLVSEQSGGEWTYASWPNTSLNGGDGYKASGTFSHWYGYYLHSGIPPDAAGNFDQIFNPTGPSLTLKLATSEVAGCKRVTGTVTLSSPAPVGGAMVALSDTLSAATLPATLNLLAGTTSKSFAVSTVAVAMPDAGTVSATLGGKTVSQPLTVRPIAPLSVSLTPTSVVGSQPVTGKATLECKAGPGPITVDLSSSNAGVASPVAASIVVPQGLNSATFDVATNPVLAKSTATISGTGNGIKKSKALTVNVAAAVSSTSLKFLNVPVGQASAPLNVTLTNKGAVPFSLIGISLTGTAAAWFAQTNDCPASLSPGASCTISATFTPLAAASKSAKLSIATSATAAPLSVSLSGTGVIPSALLVINATPTSPTTVVVRFSANIDSSTVSATAFTFHGGLTATGFSVSGAEVAVATTTQVAGSGYVVTVDSTVRDTEGNPVSTSANSAAFQGWIG